MAVRPFDVEMLSIAFLILTCFCVNFSIQDDCIQAPYISDNNQDISLEDIVQLNCHRLRRDITNQTVTSPSVTNQTVTNQAVLNHTSSNQTATNYTVSITTSLGSNGTSITNGIIQTETTTVKPQKNDKIIPKIELNIPHNLGENGTGIRQYKDGINGSKNASSATPIFVSDPIMPEEGNSTSDELNLNDFTEPQDKLLADNNATQARNDTHEYYNSTFITDKEAFDKHWNGIMSSGEIKINNILSNSHRRASTLQLGFDFIFYGQSVKNVTIATGGFLFTGKYVHSWLAATQYIAPLMANFDTTFSNDSFVKYIDNGTSLSVLWENVVLQDKPLDGRFTFAATLYNNGDMAFAYKNIPLPIESIQDAHHPVKVGLSDAFIIDHMSLSIIRRKTIYEYHRVEFRNQHIGNNTLLWITALPSCPQFKACNTCVQHDTSFNCTWCSKAKRCSNKNDRQRQDWFQKGCSLVNVTDVNMCPSEENKVLNPDIGDNSPSYTTLKNGSILNAEHAASVEASDKKGSVESASSAGGIVAGLVALVTAGSLAVWLLYAYRNPHTNSGQLLIKYRPSQWGWRRGEARYTAATIHM